MHQGTSRGWPTYHWSAPPWTMPQWHGTHTRKPAWANWNESSNKQPNGPTYSVYSPKTGVITLLSKVQWEPLQEQRQIHHLVFLYKILNGKVAVTADGLGRQMDLVLNSRPTRGTSVTNTRDLLSNVPEMLNLGTVSAYEQYQTGMKCPKPSHQPKPQHPSGSSCEKKTPLGAS